MKKFFNGPKWLSTITEDCCIYVFGVFEEVAEPITLKLSEVTHREPTEDPRKFHDILRSNDAVMRLQTFNKLDALLI